MKTRSWNKELGKYIYFEDGYYSYFENGVENYFLIGTDFNDLVTVNGKHYQFNWQNKELSTEFTDVNNKEMFVGDYITFNISDIDGWCECYEGIIEIKDYKLLVQDDGKEFEFWEIILDDEVEILETINKEVSCNIE